MTSLDLLDLDTVPHALEPHFAGLSCLLCGSRLLAYRVAFVPNRPSDYGIPTDQTALLIYVLCAECFGLPDRDARADLAMRSTRGEA